MADDDQRLVAGIVLVVPDDGAAHFAPLIFLIDTGAHAGGGDFFGDVIDAVGPDADEAAKQVDIAGVGLVGGGLNASQVAGSHRGTTGGEKRAKNTCGDEGIGSGLHVVI